MKTINETLLEIYHKGFNDQKDGNHNHTYKTTSEQVAYNLGRYHKIINKKLTDNEILNQLK